MSDENPFAVLAAQTEDLVTRCERLAARMRVAGVWVSWDLRVNAEAAAELLGVTPETLANWRAEAKLRLRHVRPGRLVTYYLADLLAYIDARTGFD